MNLKILIAQPEAEYELLDSGENEKLERYGSIILSRPDPQALWRKSLPHTEWIKAAAKFERGSRDGYGAWKLGTDTPKRWNIAYGGLKFIVKPSAFKHTGIFPEHAPNWQWIREKIFDAGREVSVLNLFGYTGGATLAALQAGAKVCHVDGSKVAITWARENAELSGLAQKPVRWILDDAHSFVKREIRRGNKYDAIIMDPPAFGHGPEGEVWKIEDDFLNFLEACQAILSDKPLFMLVNGYSAGYSAVAYFNSIKKLQEKYGGVIESGELTIAEKNSGRLLPAGIFCRWSGK